LRAKGVPDASLVWRTGLSGGAPDSVRCTRGPRAELLSLGIFLEPTRYNSPDCPVYTGLSGVHRTVFGAPKKAQLRNSPVSGIREGCSAIIHRACPVCTGLSGASSEQRPLWRQRLPAVHLMRAQRAQKAGAPISAHRTVNSSCPVRHRTSRRAQKSKLQRSNSNGTDDVAGAPDMSGVHQTVWCAIEQTAPPTVMFGGWGYKYPNHPTIHCIQVFHSPTTTRALAFNSRHTKKIKSSQYFTQRPSD
jgi:hypothetical protein